MRPNFSPFALPLMCTLCIVLGLNSITTVGQSSTQTKLVITGFKGTDGDNANKRAATANPTLAVNLTSSVAKAVWKLDDNASIPLDVTKLGEGIALTKLEEGRTYSVVIIADDVPSVPFIFKVDTLAPKLSGETPQTRFEANGGFIVSLSFTEPLRFKAAPTSTDARPATEIIELFRESSTGKYEENALTLTGSTAIILGNKLEFNFGALPRGNYRIKFKSALEDAFGLSFQISASLFVDFSVLPPPASVAPTLELPNTVVTSPDGSKRTRFEDLKVRINGVPQRPGKVHLFVNNVVQNTFTSQDATGLIFRDMRLTSEGTNLLQVAFEDAATGDVKTSAPLAVALDSTGPILEHAEVISVPTATGTGVQLVATFADADLPVSVSRTNFSVLRKDAPATVDPSFDPIIEGRTLRFPYDALPAGMYELVIKPSLVDALGNPIGRRGRLNAAGQQAVAPFSVQPGRTFGQQVEFPPYAPPQAQVIPPEGFNPGDFVETRVARLYYYRDAHRVAQIINRNIRSFNQAAVTQAERRAENSRDDAQLATDDRRAAEREAIRAAEQARQKEQELAVAKSALAEAQQAVSSSAVESATIVELNRRLALSTNTPDQKDALNSQLEIARQRQAQEAANLARFGGQEGINALAKNVAALEQTVASYRQSELIREEASQVASAKEDRLRAQKFRDEVSAAETDPDTYVAGNLNSVDPVTQVSISVIGEGLLELRGPIKGINKIRTLINQIDTPVGQIKIGIFTVQVNGEKGEKMEKCIGDVESHIDLSRFLVNQSLNTLRRCVQAEAAMIAEQCAQDVGHSQVDRDRRYLYSFFGRDFIDELYAIDSEFLKTENTVLSLHAMDTISLNRALFILALAKNDIRERIIARFLEAAKSDLPSAEFDFRRSSELQPHVTEKKVPAWNRTHLPVANHYKKEDVIYEAVHRNAQQRYHFRNFNSFFDLGFVSPDTMNPMQREFIRLAQIFKARLVAEMEWKQRVLERGLIEDRSNTEKLRFELLQPLQRDAIELEAKIQKDRLATAADSAATLAFISQSIQAIAQETTRVFDERAKFIQSTGEFAKQRASWLLSVNQQGKVVIDPRLNNERLAGNEEMITLMEHIVHSSWATERIRGLATDIRNSVIKNQNALLELHNAKSEAEIKKALIPLLSAELGSLDSVVTPKLNQLAGSLQTLRDEWETIAKIFGTYQIQSEGGQCIVANVSEMYYQIRNRLNALSTACSVPQVIAKLDSHYNGFLQESTSTARLASVRKMEKETRVDLDHRKLLNHLIDEQEEKFIELVEGTRSHIAVLDDYLKRLSIAIEDDFKLQFYDPAFVRVREAARARQVTLSQVERTTILTNNRDFAKVDPQATMEFDLPKRQIAIKEAFDAARALVEDSGALMNDPTFLAAFQMMGGGAQARTVKNLLPTQSSINEQRDLGVADPLMPSGVPGSALQGLVPEPSIFKLETGTGFQIRPVMQPDGDSVVYDFDYMYTTNIREPVRADEKHIGRVKRHFVHTAVQTGNFELREVSRYQVALKVSRTGQGVPLLQDIPVVGAAFRPAPSDDSSIQQNIIFGQTNVYPTLYDLMGLRWAQQVVDLDHSSLLETEHVIRGRQKSMKDYVFGEASRRVDDFLDIQKKDPSLYRPDLYHPQSLTSPYHPDGYKYSPETPDPTGNNYQRVDRRPADMQDPPYERYRHRPAEPETIQLQGYEAPVAPAPVPTQGRPGSMATRGSATPIPVPPQSVPRPISKARTSAPTSAPQKMPPRNMQYRK